MGYEQAEGYMLMRSNQYLASPVSSVCARFIASRPSASPVGTRLARAVMDGAAAKVVDDLNQEQSSR